MTEEIEPRQDVLAYCPRVDKQILVLSGCCFYRERDWACFDCVFNQRFIEVKLTILLKEMLESKGPAGREGRLSEK